MVGALFLTVKVGDYKEERAGGSNDPYGTGLDLETCWTND